MLQAMEILEGFPPDQETRAALKQYDQAMKQYASALGKLDEEARAAVVSGHSIILKALDPAVNSIGYLTVLDILYDKTDYEPSPEVLDSTLEFLVKFDPYQVRHVGAAFSSLLHRVGSGTLFSPLVAVELIATAILRLDPSGSMFSTTHLVLARLAYTSNGVEPALKVLDADILFYPYVSSAKETRPLCDPNLPPSIFISTSTGLTEQPRSTMILEYDLLRGLIYMSRRDWCKALGALEKVITHPCKDKGVSKIMTEAHKKWVLVGLLHQGKAPSLPSYTNSVAQAAYIATNKPYNTFADLFSTDKVAELKTEFEANRQTWDDDNNTSLVAEVFSAYQKWQIINLRDVYQQISMSQLRKTTLSAETGEALADVQTTLALVREMIESGMLNGEIKTGQGDGEHYLAFGETQSLMSEAEFAKEVARSHGSIALLSTHYRMANEGLDGTKEYLRHLIREQKRAELDKETDAGMGFESQVEDEDLMAGVLAHA